MITHEMHVIRKICHRVAVMESGRIVELGSVLDVFKNPQQPITKRFVQQVTEPEETKETVEHLVERYHSGQVVQLTFIGESAEQPVMTNLIRHHRGYGKYFARENFPNSKRLVWHTIYSP